MMNIPAKPWTKRRLPKRILVIRLQAMGDVVATLPYLQGLRNSLPPSVRIDFLTREETEGIPKSLTLFDHVYTIGGGRNLKRQLICTLALLPRLMLQRYAVIIDLQHNIVSKIVRKVLWPKAWSLFDRFSPIHGGERYRLTIEAAGILPNLPHPAGVAPSQTNPTQPSGITPNQPASRFQLKDSRFGMRILKKQGWNGSDALVVLNPAGAFPTRHWDMDNYVAFAHLWLEQYPATRFLLLGTAFIADKATFLQQQLGEKLINLVGKTSSQEAFAILQHATLVLSEDSGLMHMAWVSGIPTMALLGSTRSDWSRPLGEHTDYLDSSDLSCGNCMQSVCQFGDVHCMTRYTPGEVARRVFTLMHKIHHPKSYPCYDTR